MGTVITLQYKDTDPEKILEALCGVRRPVVRVVGVRTARLFQLYKGGCLVGCKPACYWKPFYEVYLPDAVCSEPVLVPIPVADCELHKAVQRAANNLLEPQPMVVVLQLSGGDTSCVPCDPPCHAPCCSGQSLAATGSDGAR